MSCQKCEEAENDGVAYFRWGNANIGMVGCDEHLGEIFFILQNTQMANKDMIEIAKEHRQRVIYRVNPDAPEK